MLARAWHRTTALQRLLIALGAGAATFVALALGGAGRELRWVCAWDATALVFLGWAVVLMFVSTPEDTRRYATREDLGRPVSRAVLVVASAAGLLAVGFALDKAKGAGGLADALLTGTAVLAVVGGWGVLHTLYTLHYADLYYGAGGRGLSWPPDDPPDFLDFASFAFNTGMTFQVADIVPTTRAMRRAVFGHALLSYAYATVIVALAVNLIAGAV